MNAKQNKTASQGLKQFAADERHLPVIMFSAHSIPMRIVDRGDQYIAEVCATSGAVMAELARRGHKNRSVNAWQSKVGFLPWMSPSTSDVIKGLAEQGHKHCLAVPIAFTSDHIETLFEIDIEYAEEAEEVGLTHFKRSPALNDLDSFTSAQAAIVSEQYVVGAIEDDRTNE